MKEKRKFFTLLFTVFLTAGYLPYKAIGQVRDKWNGTVTFTQKTTGSIVKINEKKIDVSIVNSVVNDSVVYKADHSITTAAGTVISKKNCNGKGRGTLHRVDISGGEYYIHIITHTYNCTNISNYGTDNLEEQSDITISGQFFNNNFNVLAGSDTITVPVGDGEVTSITTWFLTRGPLDVELIVTPANYNNWMPIPGTDEQSKGNVMNIDLRVQKRNGQPSSLKVETFELTLSNTSKERGITINMPLSPSANQLPDLRFIPNTIAESNADDQFISITSPDGIKGTAHIASYDGGGWTTLTAIAILEGGLRVEGKLLTPSGPTEILIPKRKPGSIIATPWLTANGNPSDAFDEELSPGNRNNGDGLSAYEEYRGVISMGQHRRLNPQKKELGILTKQSEIGIFSEGFTRYQNASGIIIVLFDKSEIPDNRRINKNASSAHVFDQYVLRVNKGNSNQVDIWGQINHAWGLAYGGSDIPARVTHIVIDVDAILRFYQVYSRSHPNLPYNGGDLVASTTAHEVGHGTNVPHHGITLPNLPGLTVPRDTVPHFRIFLERGTPEITSRPYTINGPVGSPNNHESGNVSCFICYRNKTDWVRKIANNNELHYYKVPELPAGTIFCNDPAGTDINANNRYYGNAIKGNCLSRIKLKD